MPEPSITCPKCEMTSHHPMDVKMEWCGNCNSFHYALKNQEPIYYNRIVADLMAKYRGRLIDGAPFAVITEQFFEGGVAYWRAYIKVGQAVWNSSRNPQTSPGDALRELAERVDAGMHL